MGVQELMSHKQDVSILSSARTAALSHFSFNLFVFVFVQLEGEYQRLPITVSGKSIQVRKRKEELEFELDLVEKQIYRARQRGAL